MEEDYGQKDRRRTEQEGRDRDLNLPSGQKEEEEGRWKEALSQFRPRGGQGRKKRGGEETYACLLYMEEGKRTEEDMPSLISLILPSYFLSKCFFSALHSPRREEGKVSLPHILSVLPFHTMEKVPALTTYHSRIAYSSMPVTQSYNLTLCWEKTGRRRRQKGLLASTTSHTIYHSSKRQEDRDRDNHSHAYYHHM